MPRPGGPRGQINEKSKDFKGSINRLFGSLKKWHLLLGISVFLAMVSAILALITPNKLSDLTDTITKGISPKTDKLAEITDKISENMNNQNNISSKIPKIMTSNSISSEDKLQFQEAISKMNSSSINKEEIISLIPDSVMIILLDDIEVDKVVINSQDQLECIKILNSLKNEKDSDKLLASFDKLPKSIYNLIKPSIDLNKVKSIGLLLVFLYLISAIFSYIQGFLLCTVSNNYAKTLRTNISEKINRLPLRYFDNHEMGDVLSIVTNDVDSIAMNMNQSIGSLVTSITLFIGSIIMMFYTNWIMAVTAIVSSLLGFLLMFIILNKSQKYFNQKQVELGKLNGHIEEIYSGHNIVRTYNGTKTASKEFDEYNKNLCICNKKSQFLSGLMQPIMGFIGNFGYVAVCIVGALLTMNSIISFGVIVAFMIYVRMFTNPLSQIAQAMTGLQSTAAAGERVFEFLDEEEMSNQKLLKKKLNKKNVKGKIEFKDVKFGYNSDRLIIKDFNAKAKSGEKIAIVGPTGAGKTTMVNLLMKFYEIVDGDILIDGVSIKDLTRENIHDLFVMVLQDTWLFDGTIRDNIKFNKEHVSDDDIWKALKTVGVDHFVKTLPGGLDALLSDNDSISQGQKQLLTIARGMIEDAPFLILDEATSNVDTRTEELVQKAMDKLMIGRTSFIIAHRLSTIKNADLILVMKDGNIVETGTHNELMNKNGFYADLYNSQFEL